jgi:hypothetical protein
VSADEAPRRRPEEATDELVQAVGKVSEALEYVERARGHLFSFHQLMGHADLLLGEAADDLGDAGAAEEAEMLREEIIGRNAIDGRWTFQIVEEFDDLYYGPVRDAVRRIERDRMGGQRHVFESEMKESRRSRGRRGHDARPPSAHVDGVETTAG